MRDESVETPMEQEAQPGRRPPSLLPWVLFGVTAGILAALSVVLIRHVSAERERADEQAQAYAKETARARTAELALEQLKVKIAPLEVQLQALTTERDELAAKVRSLEAAKATGASTSTGKTSATKADKPKTTKKKKRR